MATNQTNAQETPTLITDQAQPYGAPTTGMDETATVLRTLSSKRTVIPQPDAVQAYLTQYPDIRAVMQTICRTATVRFGEQVQLSLEVYRDPEIQDEYLTLYIRQDHYDEQLLTTIDGLSAECESLLMNTSGWLLVTTDFCSPV